MPGAVNTIGTLLSRATEAVSRDGTGPDDAERATREENADDDEERPTLRSCTGCRRTYLGDAVESCSECGSDLEEVPDEHELGLV